MQSSLKLRNFPHVQLMLDYLPCAATFYMNQTEMACLYFKIDFDFARLEI